MICTGVRKDVEARKKHLHEMNAYEWVTDEAYCYWIEEGIPDEASDDDINFIAENIEVYNDVCEAYLHAKIIDIMGS